MSWASDMGYDCYDLYDMPSYKLNESEHWPNGKHFDAKGKGHLLSEMSSSYLKACINKWPCKDTTPLQEELNKRTPSPHRR